MSKAGQRRLEAMAITLTVVRRLYPRATDTVDLLAQVLRGSSYDSNSRNGISDPTPSAAYDVGPWLYWQRDVDHNLTLALHHLNELYRLMNRAPSDIDTKALVRQHQCQGGRSSAVDPDDPAEGWRKVGLCEEIIGKAELCPTCYQRKWRWARREHSAA